MVDRGADAVLIYSVFGTLQVYTVGVSKDLLTVHGHMQL